MKEEFYECSVAPKKLKSQKVFYYIYSTLFILSIIVFCALLWFCVMFGFDIIMISFLIMVALFATGCYFIKRKTLLYFDYTYISGEIRIIRVINGKYRRKFMLIQCKDITQIGKVSSDSFDKFYDGKEYKKKMATPNGFSSENELYYIAGTFEGEKSLVILECDEKFIAYIVAYRGKSILDKDFNK